MIKTHDDKYNSKINELCQTQVKFEFEKFGKIEKIWKISESGKKRNFFEPRPINL